MKNKPTLGNDGTHNVKYAFSCTTNKFYRNWIMTTSQKSNVLFLKSEVEFLQKFIEGFLLDITFLHPWPAVCLVQLMVVHCMMMVMPTTFYHIYVPIN